MIQLTKVGCVLVLFHLAVSTTTETQISTTTETTQTDKPRRKSAVCQFDPSKTRAKMSAIDAAFGRSERTDVIFLVDRSQSISPESFDTMKESIKTLMDYLMLRRLLYLHNDYTRVAVLSFGVQSMVDFDGISSDSGTVHACNFDDKLGNIELGTSGRLGTKLDSALTTAGKIFESNPRKDSSQILWVFHDGEDATVSETFTKLKRQRITVFSAGVGVWMDTVDRENNVTSFADNIYHYACAEHWTSMIKTETTKVEDTNDKGVDVEHLYVIDDTYTNGPCSSCPGSQRCVCDITSRRYTCADVTGNNTTLTIIVVCVATVVLLVAIVVVLVSVCLRRRRRRNNRPPEIAPRVVGRKKIDESRDWDEEKSYYNVNPGQTGSEWLKQTAEQDHIYIVPMQDAIVHKCIEEEGDEPLSKPIQRSEADKPVTCETPPWYLPMDGRAGVHKTEETPTSPAAFKYDYVYEQILTGPIECRRRLVKMAESHGVRGLLIYDTRHARHWAATARFLLPPAEIATFHSVLRNGNLSTCTDVTAAGKTYTIDRTELSDQHLHATSERGEHLWVAHQGDFIIVGVAGPDKSKDCENVVFDVQQNLHKKGLEDSTETTSSPLYLTPNTWSQNLHNTAPEDTTEAPSSPLYVIPTYVPPDHR